jgi:branched-chain amino acid transport system substrate-binding protein
MKNKLIIGIIIVVCVILASTIIGSKDNKKFTVGAVLPLTGPASLWGETVKNGMELALGDKKDMRVLYEDSKSTAADGISAYNLLKAKGVDIHFSELSIVSVPLSKLAAENNKPLLVSLVAAEHSAIVNDYTTRYYTNPTNYATPAFSDSNSPILSARKIAILTRNDELGNSVKTKLIELAKTNNKEVVFAESFTPSEKDFTTVILKAKESKADVFIFVAANPGEAVGILKATDQLKLNIPIIESSAVFADLDTRKQAGNISFYSTSYDFSLPNQAVEFKQKYRSVYDKEPNFGAAFGYDVVNLIDSCKSEQQNIIECFNRKGEISGVAGIATRVDKGDFTVKMHLERVN